MHYAVYGSHPRKHILSICSIVILLRLLFATSSFAQSTGIRSDTVFCTPLRRACGASCIRLRQKNIFWRCSNKKWENTGKMFTGCSDIVLHCEIHIRSFLIVQYLTVKLYHIYQYIIVYNMYIDIICFEFERLCCY